MMKAYRWMILVVLAAAMALSACSPSATPSYSKDTYGYASEGAKAGAPAVSPGLASPQDEESNGQTAGRERMVIMNATLSIVVNDPAASQKVITDMASEMGGYVVSSNLYQTYTKQGNEAPEATVTIRVPAERLTEAMNRIKAMVKDAKVDVLSEVVTGQDVTQEYTDLSSRLRNLEATEQQLLEIQKAATTTTDIMMVFNEIKQVRGDIELIKGQMQYYEESASLSAVSVTLVASVTVEPVTVAGWQPEGIVRDALQALVDAGKWLVEVLIWLGLYILPLALVIGIPTFFIVRAYRRSARKNAAARQQVPPPYPPYPPTYPPAVPPAQPQP